MPIKWPSASPDKEEVEYVKTALASPKIDVSPIRDNSAVQWPSAAAFNKEDIIILH